MTTDILLERTYRELTAASGYEELAQKASRFITNEFRKEIIGAGIFRVDHNEGNVSGYDYVSPYHRTIDKFLPSPYSKLRVSLLNTDNLVVKSIILKQTQISHKISDFSNGAVPDSVTSIIQKLIGAETGVTIPLVNIHGTTIGAMMFLFYSSKVPATSISTLEMFVRQVGLAFSNVAVVESHKKQAVADSAEERSDDMEDIPSVKLTLRISPKQNKILDKLIEKHSLKSKVQVIRHLIDSSNQNT